MSLTTGKNESLRRHLTFPEHNVQCDSQNELYKSKSICEQINCEKTKCRDKKEISNDLLSSKTIISKLQFFYDRLTTYISCNSSEFSFNVKDKQSIIITEKDINVNLNLNLNRFISNVPYHVLTVEQEFIYQNELKLNKIFIVNKDATIIADATCYGIEIIIYNSNNNSTVQIFNVGTSIPPLSTKRLIYLNDIGWVTN
uniref:Uncharacterized protein n=1 Tax=viral metagenome TaxID=1070528 RepID=A0A6C0LU09_9ZZZZ